MTNQEIFDKLGEMGTLMALFLEMGAIDGQLDQSEIDQVLEVSTLFTDQNVMPFIQLAVGLRKEVGQMGVLKYLQASLSYFGDKFDEDTKKGILLSLKSIANADGVIHENEKLLFDLAVKEFGL
jgi:uncharacterized tellurite resistance protein B-like protein